MRSAEFRCEAHVIKRVWRRVVSLSPVSAWPKREAAHVATDHCTAKCDFSSSLLLLSIFHKHKSNAAKHILMALILTLYVKETHIVIEQ